MPRAKKLPSGSWRVRSYYKDPATGLVERKSFTAPTRREAELMEAEWRNKIHNEPPKKAPVMTVGDIVDKYIELSGPALSPTTLHRYKTMREHAFPALMASSVEDITSEQLQIAVNAEASRIHQGKRISPKTVANEYGLVSSALKTVAGKTFQVKLPTRQRGDFPELPEPAEIMAAVKGTEIELPVLLALWLSFSMSEVLGLTVEDVHGDLIYISHTRVFFGGQSVYKETAKVDTRKRMHKLPPYLLGLINNTAAMQNYAETGENGPLVAMSQSALRHRFTRTIEAAGLPRMTFHQLRHLNASVMLALNVPEKYAMERGGWKTPHIMKTVYQHTLTAERQKVDAAVNAYFERALDTNTGHDGR